MKFEIEMVRKRPGMFIGSTGQTGLHNLIFCLVEELIDACGKSSIFIEITMKEDDSIALTSDYLIDTENNNAITIVKALSDIFQTGYADNGNSLFKVLFRPDKEIFTYHRVDYDRLYNRFKELAQLNDNVKFHLSNGTNNNRIGYHNGLSKILYENMYMHVLKHEHFKPTNLYFKEDDIEVTLSMMFGFPSDASISFVNNSRTYGGGTHVKGLYDGIYYSFKKYIGRFDQEAIKLTRKDIINDLNFVISVRVEDTFYAGSDKRELSDNRVGTAIKNGVVKSLDKMTESDPSFFDNSSVIQRAAFMNIFKTALKKNHPEVEWND